MEQLALSKTNKINSVLTKLLYKTQTLAALVIQNNGEIKDFQQVAATIIDDPAIKNVILAPDGVVSDVYPISGNEKVIGFNYFTESNGNKEAIQAKNSGKLVLGGPFELVQGGQALVGRLPVYVGNSDEKRFWGLVSVTLNYPEALAGAELEQLKEQGLAYEIWRISPDTNQKQIIASSTYEYNKNVRYVEHPMEIINADWILHLSPIRSWYEFPETWICLFLGVFMSLLIGFLVLHNSDLKQMKSELEELTTRDSLTGIMNRRGIFNILEDLKESKRKFILCYIDLNKFKSINDMYGHNVGDRALVQLVSVFKQYIDEHHAFARIGGDEFILVFKDSENMEEKERFFEKVNEKLKVPFSVNKSEEISLSLSIGTAVFPKDSQNIDELIGLADHAMYQIKSRNISQEK